MTQKSDQSLFEIIKWPVASSRLRITHGGKKAITITNAISCNDKIPTSILSGDSEICARQPLTRFAERNQIMLSPTNFIRNIVFPSRRSAHW